jgi:glycosyltransferase involved in cell wall biosynthesis
MNIKTISILTPCYNEEENVVELYDRVRAVMATLGYRYEHVFIDNASNDNTFGLLKAIAARDHNVKVIRNARNFGHIRSPHHALLQTCGDCVISVVADLQDPPEMIPEFLRKWEEGYPVVVATKASSDENSLMYWLRKKYYETVRRLSGVETYENFTGFGLYDRKVIDVLRDFRDPYPYFRGMIAEIGFRHCEIPFHQPRRTRGITKNNFYTLYDMAMLGITSLSKVPLRAVTFTGFLGAATSVLFGFAYLLYKLIYWQRFTLGVAPVVIGGFFLASVQLLSLGIIGEYIGQVHTIVQNRPLVIEEDRVNFQYGCGEPAQQSIRELGQSPEVCAPQEPSGL